MNDPNYSPSPTTQSDPSNSEISGRNALPAKDPCPAGGPPPAAPAEPRRVSGIPVFAPRCIEKGCVFPAQANTPKCAYHDRQHREPDLFHSQQPSMLFVEQAKFILPDSEPDDGYHLDRRRLAEHRLATLEEAA